MNRKIISISQTDRDDFINYLPVHSERTQSGVVIGFFLRAIRVSSEEYKNELTHIMEAFKKLMYPAGLINSLKRKARDIVEKQRYMDRENSEFVTVPHSTYAGSVDRFLMNTGIKIAYSTGTRIRDLVCKKRGNENNKEKSNINMIPCSACPLSYYGGVETRIRDHKMT